MRHSLAFASFIVTAALIAAPACDEGSGTTGNDGGGYSGPCAKYTDCSSCADATDPDAPDGCDWCAGQCVGAAPYDSPDPAGASCEWGFAASSYTCTDHGGILIQPTTLSTDCRMSAKQEEPVCQRGSSLTPGSIGAGPSFPTDSGSLYGGFVDANRVVVGAYTSGQVSHGSVWSVDVASGDRTLVSGVIVDPIQGELSRGTGPELGTSVLDVEPTTGGQWIAWTTNSSSPKILRIDPATGNRTLVYEPGDMAPCAHAALHYELSYASGSDPVGIAIGSDGTIYAPLGDADEMTTNDVGIAALSTSGTCSIVTLGSAESSRRIGGGPGADSPYRSVVLSGNTLYALSSAGQVHAIDIGSGNRTLLSEEGVLGEGPGTKRDLMALAGDMLWTSGDASSSSDLGIRVDVTIADGTRAAREYYSGPLQGSYDDAKFMIPHPTMSGVAIVTLKDSVVLYEASSGNNLVLSH
ncbi:MAG: hypothetical protein HOW73_25085 [Polyangiaceae bacterium]|nr:hypothetical protein [Polyangiaceae bacterium]